MKNRMRKMLSGVLIAAIALSFGGSIGTTLGKYLFSEDVSVIRLTVMPNGEKNARLLTIETANTRNITVTQLDIGITYALASEQFYALHFAADEGYRLPEQFCIVIGDSCYTISTVAPEQNLDGIEWIPADNVLLIPDTMIPAEDCAITIYAEAAIVPAETEPVVTEAIETEPAETEPAETEPAETESVETEPIETEPAETESAETEPIETEPAETEPVETEAIETESVETEPAGTEADVSDI